MRAWTRERDGQPDDPLFATGTGRKLSRDALERRLAKHAATAAAACPSLTAKTITPHVLRAPPRCDCCTPASTPP